jgi:hypothetical protein
MYVSIYLYRDIYPILYNISPILCIHSSYHIHDKPHTHTHIYIYIYIHLYIERKKGWGRDREELTHSDERYNKGRQTV